MGDRNLDPHAQEYHPRATTHILHPPPPPQLPLPYIYPYTVQLLTPPGPPTIWYTNTPQYTPPHMITPSTATVTVVPQLPPPSASPTRTLVLSSVPIEASETVLWRELEVYGDIRGVQLERVKDGICVVHFYDLRDAVNALRDIREQHMQRQTMLHKHFSQNSSLILPCPMLVKGVVWAQYGIPAWNNQGTIVVFNLDPDVSCTTLKKIFQAYGNVKELRETPMKKNPKFVEFYDVRDAARALNQMNGKEINGKAIVIEFSRPGEFSKRFFNSTSSASNRKNLNYFPVSPPQLHFPPRRYSQRMSSARTWSSSGKDGKGSCRDRREEITRELSGNSTRHAKKKERVDSQLNRQYEQGKNHHRLCKGKLQVKKIDSRYLINEDAIINESQDSKDTRTTVMIKNIPNKYSQELLLNMLDNHCIQCNDQILSEGVGDDDEQNQQPLSSYDFVYLPIDFNTKCNVGYGFVNMTSPEGILRLYKAFHHQHWEVLSSRKICEITYARVQGFEALKEHFKNSKFPCGMENYLPVVFSPPRDGKQLTEPTPIVVQRQQPHKPSKASDDDDDKIVDGTKECTDILCSELNGTFLEHEPRQNAVNCNGGAQQNGGCHVDDGDKEYDSPVVSCGGDRLGGICL